MEQSEEGEREGGGEDRECKPGWESLSEGVTQIETQITKTALKRKKEKAGLRTRNPT